MNSNSDDSKSLEITGADQPDVPAYACIVYVQKNDNGTLTGRVANLEGIEATGNSERFVLGKVVREFKARIQKMHETAQEIPWMDPLPQPAENENVRSIPMHL